VSLSEELSAGSVRSDVRSMVWAMGFYRDVGCLQLAFRQILLRTYAWQVVALARHEDDADQSH